MFLGLDIGMHRFLAPFMRRFSAASFFVGPMYKHPSTVLCITLIRCGLLTGNGGSFATCPSLREKERPLISSSQHLGSRIQLMDPERLQLASPNLPNPSLVSSDLGLMTRRRKTWRVHRARLEWITKYVDSTNYGCSCTIVGNYEFLIQWKRHR